MELSTPVIKQVGLKIFGIILMRSAIIGKNGDVYYGDQKKLDMREGNGFKEGDKVTVTTNMETGEVNWKVNGALEASDWMRKIRDQCINWVPFISIHTRGDIVEIE